MNCDDCDIYARCEPVPFVVHESDIARLEGSLKTANRRLFITVLSLIFMLLASWVFFFVYESQMETVEESEQIVYQDADGHGNNSFVGGDSYGTSDSGDPD